MPDPESGVLPLHQSSALRTSIHAPAGQFKATSATYTFLGSIPRESLQGVKVAAFDTRITEAEVERVRILAFFVRIFGYAAKPIADRLQKRGGALVIPPEGFYVEGTEGPLQEGELERAAEWARQIAVKV